MLIKSFLCYSWKQNQSMKPTKSCHGLEVKMWSHGKGEFYSFPALSSTMLIFSCWGKEERRLLKVSLSRIRTVSDEQLPEKCQRRLYCPSTKTGIFHSRHLDLTQLGSADVLLMDAIHFREVLLLSSVVHCHITGYLMDLSCHYR